MLLVTSTVNAQSYVKMEGEYEAIYEPGPQLLEHVSVELEYEAEEGGIIRGQRSTDYLLDWCDYACSFEGTIEPGAWYLYRDYGTYKLWRADASRNYAGTRGAPCNLDFNGTDTVTVWVRDYPDGSEEPDSTYLGHLFTACAIRNTYVNLTVVPGGPGDD